MTRKRKVWYSVVLLVAFGGVGSNRYAVDYWNGCECWWVAGLLGLAGAAFFLMMIAWAETLIWDWPEEWMVEVRKASQPYQRSPGYRTKLMSEYVKGKGEEESVE